LTNHSHAIAALAIGIAVGACTQIRDFARPESAAFAVHALRIRIGIRCNVRACTGRNARLCIDARLARSRACIVTTNAIGNGTTAAHALAVLRARACAIDKLARASAIAIGGRRAFILGIGIRYDERAGTVHATGLCCAAGFARSVASHVATNVIDAEAAVALRIAGARGSIGELASTRPIAFVHCAFIVGVGVGRDWTARTIRSAGLRHAACLARAHACRVAAEVINAVIADAL
jgi:hypothetical protein